MTTKRAQIVKGLLAAAVIAALTWAPTSAWAEDRPQAELVYLHGGRAVLRIPDKRVFSSNQTGEVKVPLWHQPNGTSKGIQATRRLESGAISYVMKIPDGMSRQEFEARLIRGSHSSVGPTVSSNGRPGETEHRYDLSAGVKVRDSDSSPTHVAYPTGHGPQAAASTPHGSLAPHAAMQARTGSRPWAGQAPRRPVETNHSSGSATAPSHADTGHANHSASAPTRPTSASSGMMHGPTGSAGGARYGTSGHR